jgi:signal transduction histidine kinase
LRVAVEGTPLTPLPLVVETAMYRIVQEALTNVIKHADASDVAIRLEHDSQTFRCVIRDNGSGFDVPAVLARRGPERGLGLMGIRERIAALGGTLRIQSGIGDGTELDVAIPVEALDGSRYPAGR